MLRQLAIGGGSCRRIVATTSRPPCSARYRRHSAPSPGRWNPPRSSAASAPGVPPSTAIKHSFEKVADHWEPKEHKGLSDDQAAKGGAAARPGGRTAGGVDTNASKRHLYDLAKRLGVEGRSSMTKEQLVEAIDRANRRETRRARSTD